MVKAVESSHLDQLQPVTRARIAAEGGLPRVFAMLRETQTDLALLQASTLPKELPEELGDDEEAEVKYLGQAVKHQMRLAEAETEVARLETLLEPTGIVDRPKSEHDGVTITVLFEKWLSFQKQKPETTRKWKAYVRRFVDVLGDIPVTQITKVMVRDFVETIAQLPDSRCLVPELRKGSVRELLAWKDGEDEVDVINAVTVTKHLDCVRAMLRWSAKQDYISSNPAQDIGAPKDDRTSESDARPFTQDELKRVIEGAAQQWGRDSDRYWAMMACIYTGARREEICQLSRNNLTQVGDRWCIRIDDHAGRQIKNKASIRDVPLHSDLVAAGFIHHVNQKSSTTLLFPTMQLSAGRYGHKLGAAFNRLLREHLEIKDPAVRWHSFRHGFADACRNAVVPSDIRYRLMGHTGKNRIAEDYGLGHSLDVLAEWIDRIKPLV